MELYIDTTGGDYIEIALLKRGAFICKKKFKAKYRQAEKLLPGIKEILAKNKINIANIKKVKVANKENEKTSFTALRIGVVTANALGYALGIPVTGEKNSVSKGQQFSIVKPIYNRKPNITTKKA